MTRPISIGALLFLLTLAPRVAAQYVVDDFTQYPIPQISKPEKGVPLTDPIFHLTVTRLTDAATEAETDSRSCYAGYPKHNIENADASLLQIAGSCRSNVGIYHATTLEHLSCLPPGEYGFYLDAKSPVDPRWDDENPNVLYFTRQMTFQYYNHGDGHAVLLHDFRTHFPEPEHVSIGLDEEGDGSLDRNTWAFKVVWHSGSTWRCNNVVSYDPSVDQVLGILQRPNGSCGNWVSATPFGKVALGTSPIEIYDRRLENPPLLLDADGGHHGDFALNDEGQEVYFHGRGGWWRMEDLESGETTQLLPADIGPNMGYHISGNAVDTPGWGLVSTYANGAAPASHWADYSIFLVELTRRTDPPPRIWRIAHTHCADQPTHSYSSDPFAKFNRRGDKIWWTSNWDDADGRRDVYQVTMPDSWYQDMWLPQCQSGASRPCGRDQGRCTSGTQSCTAGRWGECSGTGPIQEVCDDQIDNDCDTRVDEYCHDDAGVADGATTDGATHDTVSRDGSSGVDAGSADIPGCIPICIDQATLKSCDENGEPQLLRCAQEQHCRDALCRDQSSVPAEQNGGCNCRKIRQPQTLFCCCLLLALCWRRRRKNIA